jgi:hypothetical protein
MPSLRATDLPSWGSRLIQILPEQSIPRALLFRSRARSEQHTQEVPESARTVAVQCVLLKSYSPPRVGSPLGNPFARRIGASERYLWQPPEDSQHGIGVFFSSRMGIQIPSSTPISQDSVARE